MIRIKPDTDKNGKKGYRIIHPCIKCGWHNGVFVPKEVLEFADNPPPHLTEEAKGIAFVVPGDKKSQLKLKKRLDKVLEKFLK
jgi:hypothetical protein